MKKLLSIIGSGLKNIFLGDGKKEPILGPCEWFYIVGLTAVTVGAVQISVAAGWITCGSVMLLTSVYSYVRK